MYDVTNFQRLRKYQLSYLSNTFSKAMDPTNKPKGPSPHYSLYQREIFRGGGETGRR